MNNGNVFTPVKFEGVIITDPKNPKLSKKILEELRDVPGVHFGKTAVHVPVVAINGDNTDHTLVFLQPSTPLDYYQMVIELKEKPTNACLFLDPSGAEIQPISSGQVFKRFAFPRALVIIIEKTGRVRVFWVHLQIVDGAVHYREELFLDDSLPFMMIGLEASLKAVPTRFHEWIKRAYRLLQEKARTKREKVA